MPGDSNHCKGEVTVTDLRLTLIVLAVIVSAAVVGAFLGQLFPRSGLLYMVPVAIGIGLSVRLIARHLESKRDS
jgi:hypothetical protein